ncbi:MAG: methyl-accepting chemotaxis protein, partial [Chloroflexota bacterium]
ISERHVKSGVKHVSETGEALSTIVDQVLQIDGLITTMAASAQEQSSALGEVNTAVPPHGPDDPAECGHG